MFFKKQKEKCIKRYMTYPKYKLNEFLKDAEEKLLREKYFLKCAKSQKNERWMHLQKNVISMLGNEIKNIKTAMKRKFKNV